MTVGCVAGDEESYETFAELFDPVIEARHNGYLKTDLHKTDLDPTHIKVDYFGDSALFINDPEILPVPPNWKSQKSAAIEGYKPIQNAGS